MSRYLENILQMQRMKAILWESLTFLFHMSSAERAQSQKSHFFKKENFNQAYFSPKNGLKCKQNLSFFAYFPLFSAN
jgi:hypothetical protein